MKRYRITYKDSVDAGCPMFTTVLKAFSKDHAMEKFFDGDDAEGWTIVKVERLDDPMV